MVQKMQSRRNINQWLKYHEVTFSLYLLACFEARPNLQLSDGTGEAIMRTLVGERYKSHNAQWYCKNTYCPKFLICCAHMIILTCMHSLSFANESTTLGNRGHQDTHTLTGVYTIGSTSCSAYYSI